MRTSSVPSLRLSCIWGIRAIMICITLCIFTLPTLSWEYTTEKSSDREILFILDVSKSMLADDISPNRIAKAQEVLISFLHRGEGVRFGLIIFAGKAFILSPMTDDRKALETLIHTITPDTIRQDLPGLSGTNIGDALLLAHTITPHDRQRDIILLTDGRANIGIDPQIVSESFPQEKKDRIYTIGIGSASGGVLSYIDQYGQRQYFYDEKGEKLHSDIDQDMLTSIAAKSGGRYYRADDGALLDTVFDTLGGELLEHHTVELQRVMPLAPLLFILLIFLGVIHSLMVFFWREK